MALVASQIHTKVSRVQPVHASTNNKKAVREWKTEACGSGFRGASRVGSSPEWKILAEYSQH